MYSKEHARAYKDSLHRWMAGITVCSFILLATAGLLALSSCAHTEAGLAREQQLFNSSSNALSYAQQVAASLPSPTSNVVEGVLAVGGALLAVWATHLQRSLKDLHQAKAAAAPAPGPTTPQPPAQS